MPKLTYEKLLENLPLLNSKELEKRSNIRIGKISDCKLGRCSMREEELERIRVVLLSLK